MVKEDLEKLINNESNLNNGSFPVKDILYSLKKENGDTIVFICIDEFYNKHTKRQEKINPYLTVFLFNRTNNILLSDGIDIESFKSIKRKCYLKNKLLIYELMDATNTPMLYGVDLKENFFFFTYEFNNSLLFDSIYTDKTSKRLYCGGYSTNIKIVE